MIRSNHCMAESYRVSMTLRGSRKHNTATADPEIGAQYHHDYNYQRAEPRELS